MNASPLLQAEGLTLRVGTRTLVEQLNLQVGAGEVWALLGPNGSGKTTLLHTLAGLNPPAAGTLRLAGRPLAAWPALEAARLRGLLPQTVHDAFSADVLDTVLMGRHPHLARWAWENDDDRAIALAALHDVDLDGFAARDVLTLSGGERQRVAIAALLTQAPPLLLLDEPLSHLDLRHQIGVLQLLRRQAQSSGQAVVLSLHDINLAWRFASHALLMSGAGVHQGPVAQVLTDERLSAAYGHPVRRAALLGQTVFVLG